MMAAVCEQIHHSLGRPKTAHWGGGKTHSLQPLLRRTCWTTPNSHIKRETVSTVIKGQQAYQNKQDRLATTDSQAKCPMSANASTDHLKCRMCAPFTRPCRCLLSRKKSFSSSDEDINRVTEEKTPSSVNTALANGTGEKMPWYLTVIHEKEQCLLKLNKEITRLSVFEPQCFLKDHKISVLQEKLTEVTNQLRLTNNDEVVKVQAGLILRFGEEIQRLQRVEEEAQGNSQLIAELREEIQRMEQPSPQWEHATGFFTQQDGQFSHSETELEAPQKMHPGTELENFGSLVLLAEHKRERDECETVNKTLIKELENIKHDYMISTGTVCSLRRALSVKEGELVKARAQVEELKQELKDRLGQLQAMSRKFSWLREGKSNEKLIATLETENHTLRQLTARLKEEVSQEGEAAARVTGEAQQLQVDLATERAAQAELKRQSRADQDTIASLHLQRNKTKVSLEQVQSRFERLRVKIVQAVYTAPGAKQPQIEISDAALLQTMQKIIDDRATFYQRLQQKGEKMPPLTTADMLGVKAASTSPKKN